MKIKLCSVCDKGIERTNNEDAVAICPNLASPDWTGSGTKDYSDLSPLGSLIVVADGMGGANAGEVASSKAIESIKAHFASDEIKKIAKSDSSICDFFKDGIGKANQNIIDYVQKNPDAIGLGTTIVILWILENKAYIAWCGDSRCYCFNPNNGLRSLTKDHSIVQEMIDSGELDEEGAIHHPDSNVITRCLGDVDADTEPEFITYDIKDGDIFLLCSDGLCGYCRNSPIEKTMYKYCDNIDNCKEALLKMALNTGGQDNISIALCSTIPQNSNTYKIGLKGQIKRFQYDMNLRTLIFTIIMLFWCVQSFGQTKRALVIGIGEQQDKEWKKINGDKDVPYVVEYLRNGNYNSIRILTNTQATKKGIVRAFQTLCNECQRGDIVYIHFSGHGQQMTDLNGDERDGIDECWIPYDAYKKPCDNDNGEKHLTDDEINVLLKNIRSKVGQSGKILVVVETCFCYNSTRGDNVKVIRGVREIFNIKVDNSKKKPLITSSGNYDESTNEELWITISACKSNQKNAELKNPPVGKLTFAIYKLLKNGKAYDNKSFELELKQFVDSISNYPQTPVVSGQTDRYNIMDILK